MSGRADDEWAFEGAVVATLRAHGWRVGEPVNYDRELALDTAELTTFIGRTQPEQWERLTEAYGQQPVKQFAKVVAREIDTRGALDVLRHGVKDKAIRFRLAYFRPAHTLAAGALDEYHGNQLTITRQLHFAASDVQQSIDLVFFVNGIPVATAELKNPATGQRSIDAKEQYRRRDHKELLFARRTLVHFAVDPDLVSLTTRLDGNRTRFLPFNQGSNGPGGSGAAGNPPPPPGRPYRTSYLWEDVLASDNFMELLQRFLHIEDQEAKAGRAPRYQPGAAHKQPLIFPRFHQWHAVKALTAHAAQHGSGHTYVVQHSAGSGKSNTIAWLAHRLSTLHDENNAPVFDKVVVLTDRTVLDKQLQDTIYQFEHVTGVVERIDEDSRQLAEALTGQTARIIISTQQKFKFILDKVQGLGQRRYAVIIDEAHSSQGGEDNAALKRALGSRTESESGDPLESRALARTRQPNLSLFAFTATPKKKTLELFPHPVTGKPEPFHVYSMRQAIDEGFILDVLRNYVTYATYFRLQKAAEEEAERAVDPRKAKAKLVRRALRSEASVVSRAQIIVDHFREHTAPRLGGRAKAMVVVPMRADAVKLYQAIRTYVEDRGFTDCGTLVAFSGALQLDKNGPEYTEAKLNGFSERELPAKFAYTRADDKHADVAPKQEYRILVAAEKYQTGFDQPLLTTMYVDKPLSGVAVVQTLSRLNRTHPLKTQDDLFILDFANKPEDIQRSFQDYYETTITEPTDPNLLFDKQHEVMAYRLLVEAEMQAFIDAYLGVRAKARSEADLNKAHGRLYRFTEPAVERFVQLASQEPEKAEEFRGALRDFVRLYGFLSQVIGYADKELERLNEYGRFLLNRLPKREDPGVDVGEVAVSHLQIKKTGEHGLELKVNNVQVIDGFIGGGGAFTDPDERPLSEIIAEVNAQYGANLSTTDQVMLGQLVVAVAEDPQLQQIGLMNDEETFGREVDKDMDRIVIDQAASNEALLVRYFQEEEIGRMFRQIATRQAYRMIRRPVQKAAEREAERQATSERLRAIREGRGDLPR